MAREKARAIVRMEAKNQVKFAARWRETNKNKGDESIGSFISSHDSFEESSCSESDWSGSNNGTKTKKVKNKEGEGDEQKDKKDEFHVNPLKDPEYRKLRDAAMQLIETHEEPDR